MTLEQLQQAARELNQLILLNPQIQETTEEGLSEKLHIPADLLEPTDTISRETARVLEELGIWHRAEVQ